MNICVSYQPPFESSVERNNSGLKILIRLEKIFRGIYSYLTDMIREVKRTECCKQQKVTKFIFISHVTVICDIIIGDSCYFGAFQIVGIDDLKINCLQQNLNLQGASDGQQFSSWGHLPFPPFSITTFFLMLPLFPSPNSFPFMTSLRRVCSFFCILFHRMTDSLCYKGPLEIFLYRGHPKKVGHDHSSFKYFILRTSQSAWATCVSVQPPSYE